MAVSLASDCRDAIIRRKKRKVKTREKEEEYKHKKALIVSVDNAANQRILLGHRDSNPEWQNQNL